MGVAAIDQQKTAPVDPARLDQMSRDAIAGSGFFGGANVVMQLARLPVDSVDLCTGAAGRA